MAMQEPQSEPSMEEILASIRRIISEEDQPRATAEPLDLTDRAEPESDDLMVFDDEPEEEIAPPPVAAAPIQATPAPTLRAAPAAPQPAPPAIEAFSVEEEPLVAEPVVHIAADAFSRLAGTVRLSEQPGQTLEGMIRQMVRPMLKEWLEQNLPAIVEARVEAELDRISRLAR